MNQQTQLRKPNPHVDSWCPPTIFDDEIDIFWIYNSAMFPVLRAEWVQVIGRGRVPLRWPDNRLVVAMSSLAYEAETFATAMRRKRKQKYYLRRMFYLFPRDIYLIRAHLQKVCAGYRMPIPEMPTHPADNFLPSSMDWVTKSSIWPGEEHRHSTWECYERMAPYFAANLAVVLARWQAEQDEKRAYDCQRQQRSRNRRARLKIANAKVAVTKTKKRKFVVE